jgi:hypothetical protein
MPQPKNVTKISEIVELQIHLPTYGRSSVRVTLTTLDGKVHNFIVEPPETFKEKVKGLAGDLFRGHFE